MFTTGAERNGADTRSWYGEPQHEEGSASRWEAAYYGGDDGREGPIETEFVPGIERPADYGLESDSTGRTRTVRQSAD